MANSTTNLDTISVSQSAKEVTANELFDSLSPASLFGRRASTCAGLVWGYYGGPMVVDGVLTPIGNSTITLAASSTVYIEASRGGVVSSNSTSFTAGKIPLYTAITGGSTVSSYTDHRAWAAIPGVGSRVSISVAGSANVTLTAAQARAGAVEFTGVLTGSISVIVPDGPQAWVVTNNTTGGSYTVTVRTASGTGIIVSRTSTAGVLADGTNVIGISAAESSMSLDQLSDVDTAGSPAADNGDVLTFDGSVWRARPLGLAIGTDVQAYDADLATIAGLTATTDSFMQAKSSAWAARTVAQVAVDLQGSGLTAELCGFRGIPQNSQSAAYTMVAADAGKHIYHPAADTTARTWTIPANGSVAFPIGTAITFDNDIGAGIITIAITTDALVLVGGAGSTGSRSLASGGQATAVKVTSTRWRISGTGLT